MLRNWRSKIISFQRIEIEIKEIDDLVVYLSVVISNVVVSNVVVSRWRLVKSCLSALASVSAQTSINSFSRESKIPKLEIHQNRFFSIRGKFRFKKNHPWVIWVKSWVGWKKHFLPYLALTASSKGPLRRCNSLDTSSNPSHGMRW